MKAPLLIAFSISPALALFFYTCLFAAGLYPPWGKTPEGGVEFTVPCVNNVPDLYGDVNDPDLVILFGGNQFMVLPELMEAFKEEYPGYEKIFYETLPPGILEEQITTGSLIVGNLKITLKPDMFVAGADRLKELDKKQGSFEKIETYYTNRLAIMVLEGNPKRIKGLMDLGRKDVKVSMPNPMTEGIAKRAMEAFRKAGGDDLVTKIMDEKVRDETTFITRIHHRQTPMRIMQAESDAGPVWITEAKFQQMIGNPIQMVEIPEQNNVTSRTAAGIFRDAPHQSAAHDFLDFLKSERAKEIYKKYGFSPNP